jgi:hypothetical protein
VVQGSASLHGCPRLFIVAGLLLRSAAGEGGVMADASMENQEKMIANQEKILANQETMIGNQQKLMENQQKLDQILANQEKILRGVSS